MIKPAELESDKGRDLWDTMTAAVAGDTHTLRRLLERDPGLSQAEYWYTQPIHFAVAKGISKQCRSSSIQAETRSGMDITMAASSRWPGIGGMKALPSFLRRRAIAGDELHRARIIRSTWPHRPAISRVSASFSTTIQTFWSAATVPAVLRCIEPF
jgi:hypothetical protein